MLYTYLTAETNSRPIKHASSNFPLFIFVDLFMIPEVIFEENTYCVILSLYAMRCTGTLGLA